MNLIQKLEYAPDQILNHVITPAVEECGYDKPIRADEIDQPGAITSQVIQHIHDSDLIIADLTDHNPNVFYEVAIAHAIKKPLIQLIEQGQQIPFDISVQRTIFINHKDLDSAAEAQEQITRQIRVVEEDPSQVDNPISIALDLQSLRQSNNPEQRSIADLLSGISEIGSRLMGIEKSIRTPERLVSPGYIRRVARGGVTNFELETIVDALNEAINELEVTDPVDIDRHGLDVSQLEDIRDELENMLTENKKDSSLQKG